ncbi:MAG: tetratricopeptide repeat protein [Bryobacteraceae bacterium]
MTMHGWTADDAYRVAERGHALYLQGRYREAGVIFEGLMAVEPGDSYAGNALAACCLALDDPQRALDVLDAVVVQNPSDLEAHSRRCEALLELGRTDEARQELDYLLRAGVSAYSKRLRLRFDAVGRGPAGAPRG